MTPTKAKKVAAKKAAVRKAKAPEPELATMSIADIEALSDEQTAELMGATRREFAASKAAGRTRDWKEAAIVATDEWAQRLADDVDAGRARVITDPAEITKVRRSVGRPALGEGDSVQIRARLAPDVAAELDRVAARERCSRSEILRAAVAEYVKQHG
jgi:Ribbon-helix-helix protein, copG family